MAEGLARALYGNRARVQSAGSAPSEVNPVAVKVMKELGISLEDHHSKSVESIDPDTVDIVITLCEEEVCPAFLGNAARHHWPISDPATQDDSVDDSATVRRFRSARDTISAKLQSARIEALVDSPRISL